MVPKKSKNATKSGAKKGKSQKVGKGEPKKDTKSKTEDPSSKEADNLLQRRKDLRVQYLSFSEKYATDPIPGVLKRIDEAIEKNSDIAQLIININCVRPNDIAAIRSTFRKYTPLIGMCFWRTKFHALALPILVDVFLMKQTLVSLQLIGNGLGELHAITLAKLCRESNKLKILMVDHNYFGGKGCAQIIDALSENSTGAFQKLSMRYCQMDESASPALEKLISHHLTLRVLDIGGNQLRDQGLLPISRALLCTKTLMTLGLAFNEISDTLVQSNLPFADLCKSIGSSTLTLVDLSGNFFGDHGMDKIFDMQQIRRAQWQAGKAPPLKVLVPERSNSAVFDAIWKLNAGPNDLRKNRRK
ncbi:hypothetical protein BATDEDRAFT_34245 [Batrachochytrium dendrobatidis JAM81]|uniref:Uncharacterized protein n=1 Tax=Batrachochytrium dendrobatidis (strain JAM81 / FGSC 10211) TaxID=684364 RepID=F4NTI6_BATDJ|nr:uncharacterized protein BATDEDRAFT_34245 [Batrachochytrium dendrobatidis JAM81]EGF83511.1 hypothetical protein BATDEDRAFT_34245 [Batrachochytrium dendrobatidis JAM81]|eukprot:XP_006675801.1 hypothetical protein BATDEDRAFT_34245 [Batrachochytrium dendrobatidis JAM81]